MADVPVDSKTLRAKHGKIPEDKFYVNIEEPTKCDIVLLAPSKRQQCVPSLSISGVFEDDGDYVNCEMNQIFELCTDSVRLEEVNACLAASNIANKGIYTNSKSPALLLKRMLPVPKPTMQQVAKAGSQEMSKDSQMVQIQRQGRKVIENTKSAQRPGTPWTEDDIDEICPVLTHRPIFHQPLPIGIEEEESPTSQDFRSPPLPSMNGEKTYPEQQHNENVSVYLEPITPGETPPALPPKNKSFSENHLGLAAYLVVDVSDWQTVEDNYYRVYTASPVRRFSLQSFQKTPPMPLPRTSKAKHGKIMRLLNRMLPVPKGSNATGSQRKHRVWPEAGNFID